MELCTLEARSKYSKCFAWKSHYASINNMLYEVDF